MPVIDLRDVPTILWETSAKFVGQTSGHVQCAWVPGRPGRPEEVQVHWISKLAGILEFVASFDGTKFKVGKMRVPRNLREVTEHWFWVASVMVG